METRTLTTGDMGRYCGVHFRTVLRWIEAGKLKAHRLPGPRGEYRVLLTDFLSFLRAYDLPVPAGLMPSGRVLIVDDKRPAAKAIERVLRGAGFETATATDGFKAGLLLQSFAPAVITLDLALRGTSGFEVIRHIQETPTLAGVKVLAISALPATELERAMSAGAHEAIAKPFDSAELVRRVAALAGIPAFSRSRAPGKIASQWEARKRL